MSLSYTYTYIYIYVVICVVMHAHAHINIYTYMYIFVKWYLYWSIISGVLFLVTLAFCIMFWWLDPLGDAHFCFLLVRKQKEMVEKGTRGDIYPWRQIPVICFLQLFPFLNVHHHPSAIVPLCYEFIKGLIHSLVYGPWAQIVSINWITATNRSVLHQSRRHP